MTQTPHETPRHPTDDLTQWILEWMPVLCTPEEMQKMVRILCIHAALRQLDALDKGTTD